ncbi:hypothetical protein ACDX78_02600 [Virgibacillus oceani]
MDILYVVYQLFRLLYVIIFFGAVFYSLKFEWGKEGKDERGKTIAGTSYSIVFPLLPLGWLIIQLISDYIQPIDYETYKLLIWFLLTGLYIIHAINLMVLKRKY